MHPHHQHPTLFLSHSFDLCFIVLCVYVCVRVRVFFQVWTFTSLIATIQNTSLGLRVLSGTHHVPPYRETQRRKTAQK